MNSLKRRHACAFQILLGSAILWSVSVQARADFIQGYAWITTTANNDDAAPATLALSTCHNGVEPCTHANYDLSFTTEGFDFDTKRSATPAQMTFGSFLDSSQYPVHNKLYQHGVGDSSPIQTVIWEYVGVGKFTGTSQAPQVFTIQHDDGVTLTVHGQIVEDEPRSTSAILSTGTYSAGAGNWPFQLVYTECCSPPAVLMTNLIGPVADPGFTPVPPGSASCDLSQANPFPVPYKASSGLPGVTFTHLTRGTRIKLYSTDGRPVQTLASDDGSDVLWDMNNSEGHAVASGVYFYFITTSACDQKKEGKVVLIR